MNHDRLTDDNFLVYCAKIYDNPQMANSEEFLEDLDRIKYIKKLITRYVESNDLKERLILNHIITLYNCFGIHLSKILYLKLEKQFHCIKPFLIMLNALPEVIYNVGNYNKVYTDEIPMDLNIIRALRKINNGY
jgi:hypothetical protein